jgi:quercetin dioxygenase-like cupin family protein
MIRKPHYLAKSRNASCTVAGTASDDSCRTDCDIPMEGEGLRSTVYTAALFALMVAAYGQKPVTESAKPLLLEKNEGELRVRRPRPQPSPASQFMLKVDPKTNGSHHFVVGTEQIAPGASIPVHKHPMEDEIVLIHSGTAHVLLGDQARDLHAGGLVFIPSNTWVGLKNTSREPLDVTFIFSAPGFDEFQRCISVPAGEVAAPMTEEDLKRCEAPGHMIYKRPAHN